MLVIEANPYSTDDLRWQAVLDRDPRADGWFYYSVRTTGMYSKPSCHSRPPRRENVQFHGLAADAEAAGYRPCRRCHPQGPAPESARHVAAVAEACALIDTTDPGAASLEKMATRVRFSRFHFHRVFKAVTGLTPHAYAAARRAERVRDALATADTVVDAIYEAGFNSIGHFYAVAQEILGMTPSSFRAGGRGVLIRYWLDRCSLGTVLVALADKGVCEILFGDSPDELLARLEQRFSRARILRAVVVSKTPVGHLLRSAELPAAAANLPYGVRSTALRERVRRRLSEVEPHQLAGTA
jgi:AraC family transcriptional regulator of adaptative response/methylated-DNA-[protein]-cysteine methyltransferase